VQRTAAEPSNLATQDARLDTSTEGAKPQRDWSWRRPLAGSTRDASIHTGRLSVNSVGRRHLPAFKHVFDYEAGLAALSALLVAAALWVQLSSWTWVSGNNRSMT
jgi:hypothetical protein